MIFVPHALLIAFIWKSHIEKKREVFEEKNFAR